MANTIVTLSGDDAELYKAFQRIIDQQNKTDAGYKKIKDASKEAAAEAKKNAREQERDEKGHRDRIDGMIGSVGGLVASYVSVTAAISLASRANADLVSNQDKAIAKARELAAAQQEAAKNMAGQTPQQISDTLQKTVPEIAQATQFSDLAKLTTALGSASSIVGEDQAKGVVAASAELTRFTPGELQATATATADIMAASGLKDAKEALALLASTGSVARPEQLSKLAQGAAVAVNASIAQAPQQDKVEAAKEGVALYSKLSKVDPTGQSAATATTDFIKQVSNVFADPKVVKERTQRIEDLKLGKTDNALAIEAAAKAATATGGVIADIDAKKTMKRCAGRVSMRAISGGLAANTASMASSSTSRASLRPLANAVMRMSMRIRSRRTSQAPPLSIPPPSSATSSVGDPATGW